MTSGRLCAMLPLLSTTKPTVTGWSVLENCVIVCGLPFSNTLKSSLCRPETNPPWRSRTLTSSRTSSTSADSVNSLPSVDCSGFCAGAIQPPMATQNATTMKRLIGDLLRPQTQIGRELTRPGVIELKAFVRTYAFLDAKLSAAAPSRDTRPNRAIIGYGLAVRGILCGV